MLLNVSWFTKGSTEQFAYLAALNVAIKWAKCLFHDNELSMNNARNMVRGLLIIFILLTEYFPVNFMTSFSHEL